MKKVLVELNERELNVLKRVLNENEVIEVDHIDQNNYKKYIGKTVKVKRFVDLDDLGLTKLPINFTTVGGSFYCAYNELTSLEGCPKEVGGHFYCVYNKLTSLEGAPEKVGGDFYCYENKLTSLKGAPVKVGGDFDCSDNPLVTFEGKPKFIGGKFRY